MEMSLVDENHEGHAWVRKELSGDSSQQRMWLQKGNRGAGHRNFLARFPGNETKSRHQTPLMSWVTRLSGRSLPRDGDLALRRRPAISTPALTRASLSPCAASSGCEESHADPGTQESGGV